MQVGVLHTVCGLSNSRQPQCSGFLNQEDGTGLPCKVGDQLPNVTWK